MLTTQLEDDPAGRLEQDLRNAGVPLVVDLATAAKIAGKSPKALANLARDGVLHAARTPSSIGRGHWRVTRRALAAYLAGGGT